MYQNLEAYASSPGTQPMGFPVDPTFTTIPPGFESTTASVSPPPQISTIQKIWDTIKQDSGSALQWTENAAKTVWEGPDMLKTSNIKSAISGVENEVKGTIQGVYWYAIVAVIVVAGALYFIGKGGAIKVNAIV